MDFFFRGLVLGFAIAAPVGPIGLLCIHRTLAEGRASGFISGLGAATADALYGFVAALGLTAVSSFLLGAEWTIRTVGTAFLLVLAVKIFFSTPPESSAQNGVRATLLKSYMSTLLLTIANPATILSFLAAFAGLGVGTSSQDYGGAMCIVVGVFSGSASWWLILSVLTGFFRDRLNATNTRWVRRISGILIAALGIGSLFR